MKFDGFLKVYMGGDDEEERRESGLLPQMKKGDPHLRGGSGWRDSARRRSIIGEEAGGARDRQTIVYAPTIQTIQKREYVVKKSIDGEKRDYIELKLKKEARWSRPEGGVWCR